MTAVLLAASIILPITPHEPPEPLEPVPVRLQWYNPALGGINCMVPCDVTATGPLLPEHYGRIAACPAEWLGMTLATAVGSWQCMDTGGAIKLTCRQLYIGHFTDDDFCYWPIDILAHGEPEYAYEVFYDWHLGG